MKYLRVKNWEKFQHDSTKPLPWIKFFTALLAPTKEPWYSELPDATKALLHHIWLMARVFNNRIPETWVTKEKLNLKSILKIELLLDSGAIWYEDETGLRLPHTRARDARSGISSLDSNLFTEERESEGEPFDRNAEFETLFKRHPRPLGKKAARRHFDASVRSVADLAAINHALDRYIGSAVVARGFIQHAATWFNDWRSWENWVEPQPNGGAPKSAAVSPENQRADMLRNRYGPISDHLTAYMAGHVPWRYEGSFTPDEWQAYRDYIHSLPHGLSEAEEFDVWIEKARRKTA